jgi:hypothetical protein
MINQKLITILFHNFSMTLLGITTILILDLILVRGKSFLAADFSQDIEDKVALFFTCLSLALGLTSSFLISRQWYRRKKIQVYLWYILLLEVGLLIGISLLILA